MASLCKRDDAFWPSGWPRNRQNLSGRPKSILPFGQGHLPDSHGTKKTHPESQIMATVPANPTRKAKQIFALLHRDAFRSRSHGPGIIFGNHGNFPPYLPYFFVAAILRPPTLFFKNSDSPQQWSVRDPINQNKKHILCCFMSCFGMSCWESYPPDSRERELIG